MQMSKRVRRLRWAPMPRSSEASAARKLVSLEATASRDAVLDAAKTLLEQVRFDLRMAKYIWRKGELEVNSGSMHVPPPPWRKGEGDVLTPLLGIKDMVQPLPSLFELGAESLFTRILMCLYWAGFLEQITTDGVNLDENTMESLPDGSLRIDQDYLRVNTLQNEGPSTRLHAFGRVV